jgi:hypothetical protein
MKRYYLSPISAPDAAHPKGHRPTIADAIEQHGLADAGQAWAAWMPDDVTAPGAVCLVVVNVKNHLPLLADNRFDDLPDVPLDVKVNSINNLTRNRAKARLVNRGFPQALVDEWFERGDGYREAVRGIGQRIAAGFSENNLDVAG